MKMFDYEFKPIATDNADFMELAILLQACFPNTEKFTEDFLKWQYTENPFGNVQGFNAFCKGELVATCATIPVVYQIEGEGKLGLLSVNTATHTNHRGKSLFIELAKRTYTKAENDGFSFVIAVANQNSIHGFIKKLAFELVQQLHVIVGTGNFERNKGSYDLSALRNSEFWKWRLSNPSEKYIITERYITTEKKQKKLSPVIAMNHGLAYEGKMGSMKMWIGIDNNLKKKGLFLPLPEKLKPSPLNLIYKDLTGNGYSLRGKSILFELVDFDAY